VTKLRRYSSRDFDTLLDIDQKCFVAGIAYSEEELRGFLDQTPVIALVGEDAGAITGFIIADHFRSRRLGGWVGHIITIDVLPEGRRSGLGTQLLSAAEEELKAAGCGHVWLEVAVDNAAALRFYKKHGYTILKTLPRYYLDSIDGLLMGKKL
jgi:ribosomal-protein-alanine N-acetyltransferase